MTLPDIAEDRARWLWRRRLVFGLAICGQLLAFGALGVLAWREPGSWPVAALGCVSIACATVTAWFYIAHVHKADELAKIAGSVAEGVQAGRSPGP